MTSSHRRAPGAWALVRSLALQAAALVCPGPAAAGEPLRFSSEVELREHLASLGESRLAADGLHLDASRARLTLSRPLPVGEPLESLPLWHSGQGPVPLPLQFELRPASGAPVVRATLAAPLHGEVWTVSRRFERGDPLSCDDLHARRRDIRSIPADALGAPCRLAAEAVVLRRLGPHDVVRRGDVGVLPDVVAERELRLVVNRGSVAVQARAVALSDGRLGETVRVRVPGRPAVFNARVTAPGVAALAEDGR